MIFTPSAFPLLYIYKKKIWKSDRREILHVVSFPKYSGHPLLASPGIWAGNWIEGDTAGTWTSTWIWAAGVVSDDLAHCATVLVPNSYFSVSAKYPLYHANLNNLTHTDTRWNSASSFFFRQLPPSPILMSHPARLGLFSLRAGYNNPGLTTLSDSCVSWLPSAREPPGEH